jgi:Outer membrane protein beta-barrel domain
MSRQAPRRRLTGWKVFMVTRSSSCFALAVAVFTSGGATAFAQTTPSRLSVAGGAGVAKQTYGELNFDSSPAWDVSVRIRTSPHLAFEGLFDRWREAQSAAHLDQLLVGPDGPLGHVARIDERTTYRMGTLGFNVLAIKEAGRVTVAGGGGAGIMAYERVHAQEGSGCEPNVAAACTKVSNTFSSSSVTGQATGSLDVAITRHVGIFGRYDLIVPVQEPGFLHDTFAAGLRVSFR